MSVGLPGPQGARSSCRRRRSGSRLPSSCRLRSSFLRPFLLYFPWAAPPFSPVRCFFPAPFFFPAQAPFFRGIRGHASSSVLSPQPRVVGRPARGSSLHPARAFSWRWVVSPWVRNCSVCACCFSPATAGGWLSWPFVPPLVPPLVAPIAAFLFPLLAAFRASSRMSRISCC